ncbi:MAG TPA: ATP-binding protein [Phnomibacter sp.]|nr:ATP-binding protein [Phnomibacter sp.]
MELLDISLQARVIIGITAMVLLFTGFLVVFVTNQRKKLLYHKNLQEMQEQQKEALLQQNALLEQRVKERTIELSEQKDALQVALSELKASQLQLVQKEKMASLGELAAGVAHEIQNPLNFVLNFSDISADMVDELKERMEADDLPAGFKAEMQPLANDIADNMRKILQHGKKADGIVKNMLQHTRVQNSKPELTDLNELVSEHLKLAYHQFRTRHKSFACTFNTALDGEVGKLYVGPQEIGHALTNLLNNAFYAMAEKAKKGMDSYEPALSVTTRRLEKKVLVEIADNGQGMDEKIIHKIFQPFFTTKPTGEATGLGLSLTYDIIKAHQGEIEVESKAGEYAKFKIILPA